MVPGVLSRSSHLPCQATVSGGMDRAATKSRGAEGRWADAQQLSLFTGAVHPLASSEVSAVLRQNGQVAFSLAPLDRARSKHRHILKIP